MIRHSQETALLCLAELSELPGRLQRLPSLGALLANRTSLGAICGLFERYEGCLQRRVFNHDGKERETKSAESATKPGTQRCSLNSPLNGLARLGLAPMCANQTRSLANASSPACLASPALARCQGPVEALGRAVQAILHGGSHGPAHLCQAFYSLREAFSCGRLAVNAADCPEGADTFVAMAEMLETVGREEGCPAQAPANLQALLAPAARPPPQARPLPANVASPPLALACPEAGQQQFQRCIQPLSVFQPHPLTVIKQPRQITDACLAFGNFSACRVSLEPNCVPLWARGMAAMFEFACGPGNGPFLEIRQCLRRTVGRPELRQCVIDFSRASPQEACPSSGQLLACAVPVVEEKCGSTAGQFLRDYVGRFATALEPTCPIGQPIRAAPAPPAVLIPSQNCSAEQRQLIEQCGAPLGQLRAQLDGMFQGGLQTLLKNLNGLATLFQQGCALSAQARACLDPVLASPDAGCSVSSCLVAAGVGICEQPDVGAAIDANLGCVFRQVSNPDFGQCIRTTLGPLRQLNLTALRSALPNFVSCVEPIVVQQCGQVPLNVLRVLSSKAECPLAKEAQPSDQQQQKNAPEAVNSCTPSLRKSRQECQSRLLTAKYQFVPGLLLNLSAVEQLGQLCEDLAGVRQCEQETRPCDSEEPYGAARALLALGTAICSSRAEFSRHWECLNAVSQSEEGRVCATPLADVPTGDGVGDQLCGAVNASSQCLAPRLFSDCGPEALHFVFGASNEFLAQMIPGAQCRLETPALALQTGCPEQQLIAFLQCESGLDGFRPRPVALIGNQSKWDEFCAAAQDQFRPCVQALECRPEPATSAALFLHETVCEREIARRDQRQFGPCFLAVTEQEEGRHCLDPFRTVDLLAKNEGAKVCAAVDRLLHCLAKRIHVDCGEEALLHLFDLYNGWANVFHSGCPLSPPELGFGPMKEPKGPEVDFSKDQTSLVINGSMIEQANDDVEWVQGSSSSSAVPETSSGDSAETTADVSSEISSSFSSTTGGGTTIMNPSATTTQQSPTTTAAPPAPAADEGKQKEKSSSGARRDGRMADYLLGALASLLLLAVEAGLI